MTLTKIGIKVCAAKARMMVQATFLIVKKDLEKFVAMKTQQNDQLGKGSPT